MNGARMSNMLSFCARYVVFLNFAKALCSSGEDEKLVLELLPAVKEVRGFRWFGHAFSSVLIGSSAPTIRHSTTLSPMFNFAPVTCSSPWSRR